MPHVEEQFFLREFGLVSGPMSLDALKLRVLDGDDDVEISNDGENFVPLAESKYAAEFAKSEKTAGALNFAPEQSAVLTPFAPQSPSLGQLQEASLDNSKIRWHSTQTAMLSGPMLDLDRVEELKRSALRFQNPEAAFVQDERPKPKIVQSRSNHQAVPAKDSKSGVQLQRVRPETLSAGPRRFSSAPSKEASLLDTAPPSKKSGAVYFESLPVPKAEQGAAGLPVPKAEQGAAGLPVPKGDITRNPATDPQPAQAIDRPISIDKSLFASMGDSDIEHGAMPHSEKKQEKPARDLRAQGSDDDPLGLFSLFGAPQSNAVQPAEADIFFTGISSSSPEKGVAPGEGEVVGVETYFGLKSASEHTAKAQKQSEQLMPEIPEPSSVPGPELATDMSFDLSSLQKQKDDEEHVEKKELLPESAQTKPTRRDPQKADASSKRGLPIKRVLILFALLCLCALIAYVIFFQDKKQPTAPQITAEAPKSLNLLESWASLAGDRAEAYLALAKKISTELTAPKNAQEALDLKGLYLATASLAMERYPQDLGAMDAKAREFVSAIEKDCQSAGWCALGLAAWAAYSGEQEKVETWSSKAAQEPSLMQSAEMMRAFVSYKSLNASWHNGHFGPEEVERAQSVVKELEKLADGYNVATLWQARLLWYLEQPQQSQTILQALLGKDPDYVSGQALLAFIDAETQREEEAQKSLEALLGRKDLSKTDALLVNTIFAHLLTMQGKWEQARTQVEKAIETLGEDPALIRALMDSFYVSQQYFQSVDYFTKLAESKPDIIIYRIALITSILNTLNADFVLMGAVQFDEAVYKLLDEKVSAAVSQFPTNGSVWAFQGLVRLKRGDIKDAEIDLLTAERFMGEHWLPKTIILYMEAKSDDPSKKSLGLTGLQQMAQQCSVPEQFLWLQTAYRSLQMPEAAQQLNLRAMSRYPLDLRFLSEDFYNAVQIANDVEVAKSFEKLRAKNYALPSHLYLYAKILHKKGELKKAIDLMTEAIVSDANNMRFTFFMGVLYFDSGMFDASKQYFEKVLSNNPADAQAQSYLGYCNLEMGNSDIALQNFQQAIDLNPESVQAQYGLGLAMIQLGRRDEAVRAFSAVIERYEGGTGVKTEMDVAAKSYFQRAMVTKTTRRRADAQKDFVEALRIEPDNIAIASQYAIYLYEMGSLDSALQTIQTLRRFPSLDANIYYLEGIILLNKHKPADALKSLELARDSGFAKLTNTDIMGLNDPADVYLRLAYLYRDSGQKSNARQSMEIYLQTARELSASARKELEFELDKM